MMSTLTCSGVSSAERSCCLASSDQGGPSDPFPNPHKPKQEPSVPMVHRLPPKPDLQAKSPPPCPRGSSGGTPPNPPPSSSCGPQSVGGKTRRFILEFGPSSIGGPSAIILLIQQHLHHFLRPAAEGKQSNNAPGLHWPRSVLWWLVLQIPRMRMGDLMRGKGKNRNHGIPISLQKPSSLCIDGIICRRCYLKLI